MLQNKIKNYLRNYLRNYFNQNRLWLIKLYLIQNGKTLEINTEKMIQDSFQKE